jgi:hypothetical protein
MMKLKLLAAVASIAFVATGVSYAQENTKHEQRAEPKAGGAIHEQGAPKAAQSEPRKEQMKGANPAARAEGERNEMKGGAERPRAAEAPGQERKANQQGQNERPGAEGQKHTAQPHGAQSPAARTGANEQEKNAPKTGANEQERNAPRTGANEQDKNAPKTGAKEQDRNAPRTGAKEQDRNAPRTGANEQERNSGRTAGHNEGRGQARVQGNVKMSSEHANRVSETLMRQGRRESVHIDVRVGARVPETVQLRPLPADVIAFVPEYRGYDYFIDESDEIVFVAPQTHEIVGMIEYEGRAASEDNYNNVGGSRPCPTEK